MTFKQSIEDIIQYGHVVNFVAHDLKLDKWFIVTELHFNKISGEVSRVHGYDPTDCDKDGYTWYGGQGFYCGKPRYEVYHRLTRQKL